MKTFRLQHPDTGKGPYMSQGDVRNTNDEHDVFWLDKIVHEMNVGKSPEPNEDKLLQKNYSARFKSEKILRIEPGWYVFAFESIESMFAWFSECGVEKMVHWYGFELVEKDIPSGDVVVGDAQCMIVEDAYDDHEVSHLWTAHEVREYARDLRRNSL
jgi:hypothetical protein